MPQEECFATWEVFLHTFVLNSIYILNSNKAYIPTLTLYDSVKGTKTGGSKNKNTAYEMYKKSGRSATSDKRKKLPPPKKKKKKGGGEKIKY